MTTKTPGILHVVLSLGTGGTERLVIDMASRLRGQFRVAVCCLDDAGARAHELTDRGIPVTALGRKPGFHPALAYRIATLARHHRVSLIHCHHYSPFVYGRLATLSSSGAKLVFTEHGRLSDGPPSAKRRLVNPLLCRLPASIFSVSDALRSSMIAEGFPAARVRVIRNGIDPGPRVSTVDRQAARLAAGLPADAFVVGTVARLDPVKDLGMALRAFAEVRASNHRARLLIVGDGSERRALETLARSLNVSDAVRFLGDRPDARRLLPACDVYMNSSISEGISLTILEAMAAGLPVVATQVGGTPEVITDQRNGLLVEARLHGPMAAAISHLDLHPERRQMLGNAARLSVEAAFTVDGMIEQYQREYARLAS